MYPTPSPRAVTYWPPTNGECTFPPPRLIGARWDGDPQRLDEVVLEADVQEEGYIFFGVSRDLDPKRVFGARQIHSFSKIPNLRNLETVRVAVLC